MKTKKYQMNYLATFIVLSGAFIFGGIQASAQTADIATSTPALQNELYSINLDAKTIEKGYTVTAFSDGIKFSLVPGILSSSTKVDVLKLNEDIATPTDLTMISDIYQFEFVNKRAYDNHKPFYIQFKYNTKDNYQKKVYFYDKNYSAWRELPTRDFPNEGFVRSLIHLPFARIAVFSDRDIMTVGSASWYKHKTGLFAASPDFPQNSRLRVYNLSNDKFVDVTINDYGPDRKVYPERVVDLEKTAFAKIADPSDGVVKVKIEELPSVAQPQVKVLGFDATPVPELPDVDVKAAIAVNEDTGEVLWTKNESKVLPLASLTKMVAVKVFLDNHPSLTDVVTYLEQDENYNYAYCEKWQSARLRVEEGETLTVKDLVYAALTGSANNAVESLVRVSGLKRNEFIEEMNATVKKWGANETKFVEPTGLSPENVSSAEDYAIIASKTLSNSTIMKASTAKEYAFTTINTMIAHTMKNTDQLVRDGKYTVTGSKTGYLDEAGYCLMVRTKDSNGQQLIVVTFGADTKAKSIAETEKLIKYGLNKI